MRDNLYFPPRVNLEHIEEFTELTREYPAAVFIVMIILIVVLIIILSSIGSDKK